MVACVPNREDIPSPFVLVTIVTGTESHGKLFMIDSA